MIKAVLFDFDGVLTPDKTGSYTICNYISRNTGIDFDLLSSAYKKYNNDLLYGRTEHKLIWNKLCSDLNYNIDIKYLIDSFINTPINKPVLDLAVKLKSSYKTGIITDNKKDRINKIAEINGFYNIFDVISVSADTGSGKDNELIFKKTIELLNIEYHESIFIDNQKSNLTIPEKLGMKTIFYDHEKNDVKKLIEDLKMYNIII